MNDDNAIEWKPSLKLRAYWKCKGIIFRIREMLIAVILAALRMAVGKSRLTRHAETELRKAGLFDKDGDYDGMIGPAIMNMIYVFGMEGHSGYSAGMTIDIFNRLARYRTLTPITSDPGEWTDVSSAFGNKPEWQNKRDSRYFSHDGGETWYNYEDCSYIYELPSGTRIVAAAKPTEEDLEGGKIVQEPKCDTCIMKEECERKAVK